LHPKQAHCRGILSQSHALHSYVIQQNHTNAFQPVIIMPSLHIGLTAKTTTTNKLELTINLTNLMCRTDDDRTVTRPGDR